MFVMVAFQMVKMEFTLEYRRLMTKVHPILASLFLVKVKKLLRNLRLSFGKVKKIQAQAN